MISARFALSALLTASLLAACGDGSSGGGPNESPTNSGGPVVTTPALLESLPLDLASIDYAAVLKFADQYTNGNVPIADYGDGIEGSSVAEARLNPQPTFWAPIGTPVLAPITGVVVNVQELYSGDFTIMYAALGADMQGSVWGTEHVLNPTVKVGDSVTAGQPVAEVSDYECFYSKKQFGNDALVDALDLHRRLVGLDLGEHVTRFDRVANLDEPFRHGPGLHRRRQRGHGDVDHL